MCLCGWRANVFCGWMTNVFVWVDGKSFSVGSCLMCLCGWIANVFLWGTG